MVVALALGLAVALAFALALGLAAALAFALALGRARCPLAGQLEPLPERLCPCVGARCAPRGGFEDSSVRHTLADARSEPTFLGMPTRCFLYNEVLDRFGSSGARWPPCARAALSLRTSSAQKASRSALTCSSVWVDLGKNLRRALPRLSLTRQRVAGFGVPFP